jgi:putative transcriptional regulator
MDTLRGALLVAAPTLLDPNFQRTVVLVTEHTDEGAMGLVLNRPTDTTVADAAPELEPLTGPEELVHQGGPVQPRAVVVLAEFTDPGAAAHVVMGDIGFVRADAELERAGIETRRGRVYAGYAGWGPGQLEGELEDEGWIVVEQPLADELFSPGPDDLWHDVLQRQGGHLALIARMPLDPSLN